MLFLVAYMTLGNRVKIVGPDETHVLEKPHHPRPSADLQGQQALPGAQAYCLSSPIASYSFAPLDGDASE